MSSKIVVNDTVSFSSVMVTYSPKVAAIKVFICAPTTFVQDKKCSQC